MGQQDENIERCTIRNALLHFCFEERIEDVMNCEHYFLSQQLADLGFPNLGGASNRGEPTPSTAPQFRAILRALKAAWAGILIDFTERLEQRKISVSGVQTQPTLEQGRRDIPGQWAKEFIIDPLRNVIAVGEFKFVDVWVTAGSGSVSPDETTVTGVEVSNPQTGPDLATAETSASEVVNPQTGPALDAVETPAVEVINPQRVRDFDDDTILALLEEHARRVVAYPEVQLIAPGKISLMPIIRGKMRHRADQGDLLSSLKEEATWLEQWIQSKVTLHQTPTMATIRKVLGSEYRQQKARSKSAIQSG